MAIRKYGTLTDAAMTATDARVEELSSDIFLAIPVGNIVVRFMPSPHEGASPLRSTALHYVTIPGSDKVHVFACPQQELKIPCLVCKRSSELQRSSVEAEKDLGWRISPKLRIFANVLPRHAANGGPKVLGFGAQLYEAIKAIRNNQYAGGDMFNPYEEGKGFDIIVNRVGTGARDTKYSAVAARGYSALAPTHEEIDELMDRCHDLDQQVKPEIPEIVLAHFGPPRGFAAPLSGPPRTQPAIEASARPAVTGAVFARHPASPPVTAATAIDYDDDFNPIV